MQSRFAVTLCLFFAAACGFAADQPEIECQLSSNDIFEGESVQYQVDVKNVKSVSAPDTSALNADFSIKLLGDQPQNQSFTSIVNGHVTQHSSYSHIFLYELAPRRAGTLSIPGPSVTVENKKISGPTLALRVRPEEKQDIVLMEILPSRTVVYPTQPFDITLKILVKPLPGNETRDPLSPLNEPPQLHVGWLEPPEGLTPSGDKSAWLRPFLTDSGKGFSLNGLTVQSNDPFSIFDNQRYAVLSLYTGRESRPGLDGTPINYYVYELKRTFTPQKTGTFTFGQATVKGGFVEGVAARRFSARRLVLSAPPKDVVVREVPAPAPPTFCGGIGAYAVEASASPHELRVGDPLTYKIKIERKAGSGSLDLISAPNLESNAELSDAFDILDKNPTGEARGEVKTFSYGLRPKRADVKIPGVTVTTFDPNTEKFSNLSTEPIELKVVQSSKMGTGDLVSGARSQTDELRNREGGIFQNFTNMAALQDQRPDPVLYASLAAGLWMLFGVASFVVQRRRRLANDAAWQRRQRARPEADRALADARAALTNGKTGDTASTVRAAVAGMIGNMLDLPAAGMTAHEAGQILEKAAVNGTTRTQAVELLETIEALEYSPGAGHDHAALIARAEALLPQLQRELNAKV
jgi:hypothetical protein